MSTLAAARAWAAALATTLALLTGCATLTTVSSHDRAAVERIDEIARQSLEVFQDLLALPVARRAAAVTGPLAPRYGKVETLMRLHLLRETARQRNDDSIRTARGLLENWREFGQAQRDAAAQALDGRRSDALGDLALDAQRQILERQLVAALEGEEAKKLGGSAK